MTPEVGPQQTPAPELGEVHVCCLGAAQRMGFCVAAQMDREGVGIEFPLRLQDAKPPVGPLQ